LHNLKPVNGSVNSSKSGQDFYESNKQYCTPSCVNTDCHYDTYTWDPRYIDKAEVAITLFYMDTRYEGIMGI
jgi:endonuclease I